MARTHKVRKSTAPSPLSDSPDVSSGAGPGSGGQSGDTQGLSGIAEGESESVRELVEEGQFFEAAVVSGVENVPDADEGEIRTREVPEDDVPSEYLKREQD
jgi:hypothetical protein